MIVSRFAIASTAILVSFLFACRPEAIDEKQQVIATVDSRDISVDDFEKSYIGFLISSGENDSETNRYRHLRSMIDNILMADIAVELGLNSDSLYRSFESREIKKALGGRFYETALLETLQAPTEDEIRRAFAVSKDKVVVRHLFYRSMRDAAEAHARLLSGVSFVDEAQRCYQTTQYDSTAGYLGAIGYYSVDDAFAEVAFKLAPGEFSEPVRSRVGYHIIKVDERTRNPLMTESEFQTRKSGITSQFKLRKRRLEGDNFVRTYMQGLDVQVDGAGIAALNEAVKAVEKRVGDQPVHVTDNVEVLPFDLGALRDEFNPETVLATYDHLGEENVFTANDYYFWLRDLPFQEASNRTAASVGRALRNEIFADAAINSGLSDDPKVLHDVELATRSYLSSAARVWFANQPPAEPTDSLIQATFDGLRLGERVQWTGSFSVIPFASFAEAEAALDDINSSPDPTDFPAAEEFIDVDFALADDWGAHASRIPVGEYRIVVLEDSRVGIVHVAQKTASSPTLEDVHDQLRESLRPHVNEYNAITKRRNVAEIRVDTTLFELIMDLDR